MGLNMKRKRRHPKHANHIRKRQHRLHDYPKGWEQGDWLVPYIDDHARIHHHHDDVNNHSLCGPQIFCCRNAAKMLLAYHPDFADRRMTWSLTDATHLLSWNVPWFYIFFCDPNSSRHLRFVGIPNVDHELVLHQRRPLSYYLPISDLLLDNSLR